MPNDIGEIWRHVRDAPTFEGAVDALGHSLAGGFVPAPLRAVGVLRTGEAIRAVHTVPLEDPRLLDGTPVCTVWRSLAGHQDPLLLRVRGDGDRKLTLQASHQTREGLIERGTTAIVASPMCGGRGFVAWEFADTPTRWQSPADTACALSPWIPGTELQHRGGYTDQHLPVAGSTMSQVLHLLERFATQDEPVLLYGESGVGKTRLVQWLHTRSLRAGRPLVSVNLLTVEEGLRAARLFGTKRGAFTDATETVGTVARAHGGTLFIDEIDKLPLATQGQLLQLLDDGTYQPLGAAEPLQADIRIVTGTNADLRAQIDDGKFLQDLFHRITVLPVRVPPLRERVEDIVPWATWFLSEHVRKSGRSIALGDNAAARLRDQPWPGNLRELAAIVARLAAMAPDSPASLSAGDVDRALALDPGAPAPLREALTDAARLFLDAAEARPALGLEHTRALRGLVLDLAVRRHGKRDAFSVLGEARRLEGDNHHRVLKDEAEHVEQLWRLLDQPPDTSDA